MDSTGVSDCSEHLLPFCRAVCDKNAGKLQTEKYNYTKLRSPISEIAKIELLIPEHEMHRIRKMKNPLETLTRAGEQITIYRSDGSSVLLSTEQGRVKMADSRRKGTAVLMDADDFLNLIIRW